MIVSHRAPSSLNMSSYRAIWTHFKQIFMIFIDLILQSGKPLLRSATLFDVYDGNQVDEGKRSLAYSLTFQATDRTLTDKEVGKVRNKIVKRLQREFQANLRA